jgi:DNA polymerase III subunit delta'
MKSAAAKSGPNSPTRQSPPRLPNWDDLIGHDRIRKWFAASLRQNRLAGSFLFVGSQGIGKQTLAMILARTLLCQRSEPVLMQPCGSCPSCRQVAAGTHPDLVQASKPDDKTFIPLECLIGPPELRMQEGFCRDLRMRPIQGDRKVAILHDADYLNEEGANCLLKTLEEPPRNALIMLIGTSEQRQLPTIRSRCQIVRMGPLVPSDAAQLMRVHHGIDADNDSIASIMDLVGGDVHAAVRILAGGGDELRQQMTKQLSENSVDPVALMRMINRHVEEAGKASPARRAAMQDVVATAIAYYRRQLRSDAAAGMIDTDTLTRLDRCVRAIREVDRMANLTTLAECFATDLAQAQTGDRGQIGS